MNRRTLLGIALPAVALATVVTVFAGERQTVSLQIWLACFVVAFAVSTLLRLRETAPFALPERLAITRKPDANRNQTPDRSRTLRLIEGLVLRARDNPRSFSLHLQPQLVELATHFLRVNHGVDIERGDSPAPVLGDLVWLVQPPPPNRTPTLDELDRFVDVLIPATNPGQV